jgi:hypothetical protein
MDQDAVGVLEACPRRGTVKLTILPQLDRLKVAENFRVSALFFSQVA